MAVVLGLSHPGTPLQIVTVSSILLHERYRLVSGAARNDLALLLLQESPSPVQPLAPLANLKNLNNLQCLLSGPRKLRSGQEPVVGGHTQKDHLEGHTFDNINQSLFYFNCLC